MSTYLQVTYQPTPPSTDKPKTVEITYAPSRGTSLRDALADMGAEMRSARSGTPTAYDPTEEPPVENPIMTRIRLNQMQREWRTLKDKYGHLPEFWDMVKRSAT